MRDSIVRGLQQAVAELYNKVGNAGSPQTTGIISVRDFGAKGDGVTDDGPAFQRAYAKLAGTGITLWVPGPSAGFVARYAFDTPAGAPLGQSMPSETTTLMGPGVRLLSRMTFSGAQTHTIFYAGTTGNGNLGTVSPAPPTVGLASVSVATTARPTVGNFLYVSNLSGLSAQIFAIKAVSAGASPWTVTLDRPVVFPFPSGGEVAELTAIPHDIRIYGQGATSSGTGDRLVELIGATRCYVDDLHYDTIDGALGDTAFAFDIGGYDVGFSNCSVDGTGASSIMIGMSLESAQYGHMLGCVVSNCPNQNFLMVDCFGSTQHDCHSNAGTDTGFLVGTDDGLGSFDCTVHACTAVGAQWGLVLNGSTRVRVVACSFNDATINGILFNAAGIVDTEFVAVSLDGSATGFAGGTGNTGTRIRGMSFNGCTAQCLNTASDLDASDIEATGLTATMSAFVFSGGNTARVRNLNYAHSGISNVVNFVGVARGEIDGALISIGASSEALQLTSGVAVARNVRTAGNASAIGASIGAGCTLRLSDGNDFSSTGTPISNAGFCNRKQTVVANATTPVAIAWPNAKSTDVLQLELQTVGGTVGHPTYTITPGTGFTVTSQAADTSTYEYFIP